jgi:hypothetical protein
MFWIPLLAPLLVGVLYLAVLSLAGATALIVSFRVTKAPPLTFARSWKVYVAAGAYGLIGAIGLQFLWLSPSGES